MFTIDQVIQRLKAQGVRDTDLPNAYLPLDENEELVIVQDFQNKKVNLRELIQHFEGLGALDGTITIGSNGNWFINNIDTKVKAQGPQGVKGVVIQDEAPSEDVVWVKTNEDYPSIIQYKWDGTRLGIKTENEDDYTYTDLKPDGVNWNDLTEEEKIRVKGVKGDKGDQGEKGDKGSIGKQGVKGDAFKFTDFTYSQLTNLKGEQGKQGLIGPRGLQGDVGRPFIYSDFTTKQLERIRGDKGDVGLQGERGFRGEKGPEGDKGDPGNDGYTPQKGLDYFDGQKGDKGDKGDQGVKGDQGEQGVKGDIGNKGLVIQATAPIDDVLWLDTTEHYPPSIILELDKDELKKTISNTDKLPIWDDIEQRFILVTMQTIKEFLQTL